MKRARRCLVALAAAPLLAAALLVALAVATPLPPELGARRAMSTSVVLRDREGSVFRELGADDGVSARWLELDAMGERLPRAILAAEDQRFWSHPGVDPLAIVRASAQMLAERRVVSGASTLTQQLARNVRPHRRDLAGKIGEMALALRIEASLDKRAVLEEYLNRVDFAPSLRGALAASRALFGKAPAELSLAEAATLASLPRGPALYDPRRGPDKALRRRDRVLERMRSAGLATAEDIERALREPLTVAKVGVGLGAPHLVRAIMAGAIDPATGPLRNRASDVTLTLDRDLQREIEGLARERAQALAARKVGSAAVVVLDNASREILAYVGSAAFDDEVHGGQNDALLAPRQPGSALKPFVYELAMERLGYTPATSLPDVELELPTRGGGFRPNNYDGRYHGPVRLREALGNSYNVPAVWAAAAVGPAAVVERLRELGLADDADDPERYGAAIALGDIDVRLLDLANAYATLAAGGIHRPVVAVRAATGKDGRALSVPVREGRRVLERVHAALVTDVLADRHARLASFGEGNALELPFPVAAKTGTSKAFRDNVTVGFSSEVTVAVWVGNMDGSPMEGVSGISGAGPLFHDAMLAAMRGRTAKPFELPDGETEEALVCPLSGERPGPACPHVVEERFAVGKAPAASCSMHETVAVDATNGLLAGPACAPREVEARPFERFDGPLLSWARSTGRPLAPLGSSPRCPVTSAADSGKPGRLRVAFPRDGAAFSIDPALRSVQAIALRADAPASVRAVRFVVDGRPTVVAAAPFELALRLAPGRHTLRVEAAGAEPDEVAFEVD